MPHVIGLSMYRRAEYAKAGIRVLPLVRGAARRAAARDRLGAADAAGRASRRSRSAWAAACTSRCASLLGAAYLGATLLALTRPRRVGRSLGPARVLRVAAVPAAAAARRCCWTRAPEMSVAGHDAPGSARASPRRRRRGAVRGGASRRASRCAALRHGFGDAARARRALVRACARARSSACSARTAAASRPRCAC